MIIEQSNLIRGLCIYEIPYATPTLPNIVNGNITLICLYNSEDYINSKNVNKTKIVIRNRKYVFFFCWGIHSSSFS